MIPKTATGLEDKPLLPSVFRPKSTLYTTPLNVIPKTYLDNSNNTISGLNNPTVPVLHNTSSQSYVNSVVAFSGLNNPNVPTIQKPDSVFSNTVNLQASYKSFLPHEVPSQNRVILLDGNASSLVKQSNSSLELYNRVPRDVPAQNIVSFPGSSTSSLVKPYTSTIDVYTNAPQPIYERIPPSYHYGMPNAMVNFDERFSNELRNQNVGIPFESGIKPALPVKPVSTIHGNLSEINMSDQQNYSTDVYNKDSFNYITGSQASDPSIYNPSNALGELTEYSSDHNNTRPFFGDLKYNPNLRHSNLPLGGFDEENSILTNRESKLTGDYQESRYHSRQGGEYYLDDRSKDVRPSEDVERLSYLEAKETEYSPNERRGYNYNISSGSDRVDVSGRLHTRDTNNLRSYEGDEKSAYLEAREVPYSPKGHRNYDSPLSYDSRDRPSTDKVSTDRRNYSSGPSRARSRSRSPIQRHRHSSARSHRTASSEDYRISRGKDKLRNERRRLSPGRKRDSSRHSTEKRRSVSPCRKSGSLGSSVRNKRSNSRLSESARKSKSTGKSESRGKSETSDRLSSPKKLNSKSDKDKNTR